MAVAVETTSTLPPGAVIAGKYRVVRTLGEGGMGVVYETLHMRLQQHVAIKMLLPSLAVDTELVERFEREARAAATIESPNVAKVMDVDVTLEGFPYMVIELLKGHDLCVELGDRMQLPIAEAVGYVMTACAPIAQAHAMGIVHRDLKPANLFLAEKGDERVLKVLDFGIAKVLSERNAKLTASNCGLGSPHYMSPEQIRRSSDVDGRSDIWSLGVILYELLCGTVPFPDEPTAAIAAIVADPIVPPRALREEIPEELDRVIMRALEKDRANRFQTARDFAIALAPFAPDEEIVAVALTDSMPRIRAPELLAPLPVRSSGATRTPTPVTTNIALASRRPWPPGRVAWIAGGIALAALMALDLWAVRASSASNEEPTLAPAEQAVATSADTPTELPADEVASAQPTTEQVATPPVTTRSPHAPTAPSATSSAPRSRHVGPNPLTL